MASTYKLISSVTVGSGGAANIEFTSIPATYTDLNLVFSLRSSNQAGGGSGYDYATLLINNDATNFSFRQLFTENSSTVTSNSGTGVLYPWANSNVSTSSTFSNSSIYLPNYAGSNNKSLSLDSAIESNSTAILLLITAGLWANSSAITSLKLVASTSNTFVQYSTAYLYGISNA